MRRNDCFGEGLAEPVSMLSHLTILLLIEVRDDVRLDQGRTVEMPKGQIGAYFKGRTNGIY